MSGASIRDLLVKLMADTAEFQQGMTKAAESCQETGEKIQQTCEQIKSAFEAIAVSALFEGMIEESARAESAMAQVEAVIRSTGGAAGVTAQQVSDLAEQMSAMSGIDRSLVTQMEGVLLTFKNIGKDILPAASEAVLNFSTRMKTDLQTAAVQVGKALSDPVRGLTLLKRAGLSFTDAQKAMVTNFVKAGDVMDAQKIILGELETQFGGAAAAARDTLGGAMNALKTNVLNLFESLGGGNGSLRYAVEVLNMIMQQLAAHSDIVRQVLIGLAAAAATLVALRLPEYIAEAAKAFMALSLSGRATLAIAALVGVMTAVGTSTSSTGITISQVWSTVAKAVEQSVNDIADEAATWIAIFGKIGAAAKDLTAGDFEGMKRELSQIPGIANTRFVTDFFAPVKAQFTQLDTYLAKLKKDASNFKPMSMPGGDSSSSADASKQQKYLEGVKDLNNQIAAQLQKQYTSGQQILQGLRDQLQSAQAKVSGEESSLVLNRALEQLQQRAGSYAGVYSIEAKKLTTEIQSQEAAYKKQQEVIQSIVRSSLTLSEQANKLDQALKQGLINQKEYGQEMDRVKDAQQKQDQEEQKAAKDILANMQTQIEENKAKLAGQEKLIPLYRLEEQIKKQISDPKLQAATLAALNQEWADNQKIIDSMKEQDAFIQKIKDGHESIRKKIQEIKDAMESGVLKDTDKGNQLIQELNGKLETTKLIGNQIGGAFSSAFDSMIQSGQKFGQVCDQLLQQLIKIIAKAIILASIKSFFTGGVFNPGNWLNAFGGNLLKGFASGGDVEAGVPIKVGEMGEEVFIPKTNGTIIPNNQLSSLSSSGIQSSSATGSQPINISVVQRTPVNVSADVDSNGLNLYIDKYIDQSVTRALSSNGLIAQFFRNNGLDLSTVPR